MTLLLLLLALHGGHPPPGATHHGTANLPPGLTRGAHCGRVLVCRVVATSCVDPRAGGPVYRELCE